MKMLSNIEPLLSLDTVGVTGSIPVAPTTPNPGNPIELLTNLRLSCKVARRTSDGTQRERAPPCTSYVRQISYSCSWGVPAAAGEALQIWRMRHP